jgi:hypothetical protein
MLSPVLSSQSAEPNSSVSRLHGRRLNLRNVIAGTDFLATEITMMIRMIPLIIEGFHVDTYLV